MVVPLICREFGGVSGLYKAMSENQIRFLVDEIDNLKFGKMLPDKYLCRWVAQS